MPSRRDVFVNGGIYHIFNKTIDKKKIFLNENLCELFIDLIKYYRSSKADIRYSHFKTTDGYLRRIKEREIRSRTHFKIDILGYCLMPNHFHLIIKQIQAQGIIRFMADVANSLTRYYNILNERKGPLFLTQFKSRMITSREQLIHTSRYKHLNPYSSGIVTNYDDLEKYPWSSFKEYLGKSNNSVSNIDIVLREFSGDKGRYKKFVLDNAEHQKTLEYLKHAEKWL